MSLEDVDEWMARRIPIPPLNDMLDDIECSSKPFRLSGWQRQ